jgi:hypothetical protein
MKANRSLFGVLVVLGIIVLTACGGGGTSSAPPPPQASTAPVSVTVRDAPPAGITVFSFEVLVTQARLQPGNVPLVTTPIEIEVKQLEVEAAFLNTINVPAGTYTSIDVTFSNPELTFRNDSIAGLNVPCTSGSSAVGSICEVKVAVTNTISYNGAPFPLTVVANTPLGLLVDVNLSNIITNAVGIDFSAAGAMVVTQLQAAAGTGELEEVEDLVGTVTAKDTANNQFTLQIAQSSQSLTIKVDSNTAFEDFDDLSVPCAASPQNFTCVLVGQVVEVDLRLMPGGVLLAKKVEVADNDNEEELEGIVTKIIGPTQFEMVLVEEAANVANLDVGQVIQVTLLAGTQLRIDDDNLNVNSADFDGSTTGDMLVGQTVEIERKSTPTAPPTIAIDTDRVKLKGTRLTANVQSVDTVNNQFTINNLPGIFTSQTTPITSLVVQTQTRTKFEKVTNLAALQAGNTVSVRALLFKGPTGPYMVAKKVRKR